MNFWGGYSTNLRDDLDPELVRGICLACWFAFQAGRRSGEEAIRNAFPIINSGWQSLMKREPQ